MQSAGQRRKIIQCSKSPQHPSLTLTHLSSLATETQSRGEKLVAHFTKQPSRYQKYNHTPLSSLECGSLLPLWRGWNVPSPLKRKQACALQRRAASVVLRITRKQGAVRAPFASCFTKEMHR